MRAIDVPTLFIPLFGFALWACGSDATSPSLLPSPSVEDREASVVAADSAEVGLGETIVFEAFELSITYLALEGDSRCPIGVTCVWEGDAAVRIRAEVDGSAFETVLHTTLDPKSTDLGDLTLVLAGVLPHPVHDEPIEPSDTRILVRVVRYSESG